MSNGVLIFEGMKVGVLPGDFTIEINEQGVPGSKLVLSTAYNVLPIWIRTAHDQMRVARAASDAIRMEWSTNDQINRELLISELQPCMQVFVACGIALDALYDQIRPYAKLSPSEVKSWCRNGTSRVAQISEVTRRVYCLDQKVAAQFRQNITAIIDYRDKAVHPSLDLKQACDRPDIPVGVDWKFSAYKYSNAERCFRATMEMLIHLYERKCPIPEVAAEMDRIFRALEELKVITRNQPQQGNDGPTP